MPVAPEDSRWTVERVQLLRQLWGEGLSASRIALELACGITRNAVLGKVWRLLLPQREPRRCARIVKRPTQEIRKVRMPITFIVDSKPRPSRQSKRAPAMRCVQLVDLEEHHCRWPIGTPRSPDFCFCGADRPPKKTYCPFHERMSVPTHREESSNVDGTKQASGTIAG